MKNIIYTLIWYFMQLPWPVRFMAELAIYVLVFHLLARLFNKIANALSLKKQVGKIYVFIGTAIAAAIGRKYSWGKSLDDKIIDRGQKLEKEPMNLHPMSHKIVWIAVIICYVFSVMPDTPVFKYFDGKVAECFLGAKAFFVQREEQWSSGYQLYAPDSVKEVMTGNQQPAPKKDILIKIKKGVGNQGIRIYQKPSNKAKILMKFRGKGKIVYKNKIKKGKKGYWVKVYVPSKKVTGWITNSCIEKSVWKKIKGS